MTFGFLNQLSESILFPTRKSLEKYQAQEISELAYLYILALYILHCENKTSVFAKGYAKKTTRANNFKLWRTDGTDLYVLLHSLSDDTENFSNDDDPSYYHDGFKIYPVVVYRWIAAIGNDNLKDSDTKRLFAKLDQMFRISNGSMRAIRRLVQDWKIIPLKEQKLAVTRLLQFLRSRAKRGDILNTLNFLAGKNNLELKNVNNPEEEDTKKKSNFLTSLLTVGAGGLIGAALVKKMHKESASSGATCAANVAGNAGSGFDTDFDKSVYPAPAKKKQKKSIVISRLTENTNTGQYLYHTTSNSGAFDILNERNVKPKNYESFVSFSTKPLPFGDIESKDVTLVFRKDLLISQLDEVDYEVSWYHEHTDQARYIAGEGWKEQFEYEPEDSEDEFDNDGGYEEAFSNAEIDSFLDKDGEEEWISKKAGVPVQLNPTSVVGLIINHHFDQTDLDEWKQDIASMGYHISISFRQGIRESTEEQMMPIDVAEERAAEIDDRSGSCERVVWEKVSVIKTHELDVVSYGPNVPGVYGLHVGDSEYWFTQIVDDYGRDMTAYVVEIDCLDTDVLVEDNDIVDKGNFNGSSYVLLTTRAQLVEGKDFRYVRTLTPDDYNPEQRDNQSLDGGFDWNGGEDDGEEEVDESALNEISMLTHGSDDDKDFRDTVDFYFRHVFPRLEKVGEIGGVSVFLGNGEYKPTVMFMHDDKPIGYAKLDAADDSKYTKGRMVYKVSVIWLEPKYRGKSIALDFYKLLLDHGFSMESDGRQAPGGKGLWSKLRSLPGYKSVVVDRYGNETDKDPYTSDARILIYKPDSINESVEKKPTDVEDAYWVFKNFVLDWSGFRFKGDAEHVEKALKSLKKITTIKLSDCHILKDWGRRVKGKTLNNPIYVTKHPSGAFYIVLDGQHRVLSKKEKGDTTIKAYVLELPWESLGRTTWYCNFDNIKSKN